MNGEVKIPTEAQLCFSQESVIRTSGVMHSIDKSSDDPLCRF